MAKGKLKMLVLARVFRVDMMLRIRSTNEARLGRKRFREIDMAQYAKSF